MKSVRSGLETYASALSITAEEIAELDKDIATLKYLISFTNRFEASKGAYFAFRDAMVFGKSPDQPSRPAFEVYELPEDEEARPGILSRFRLLLRKIRASANFDAQASATLGLTGADAHSVDHAQFQPSVSVKAITGNRIEARWKKGKYTGAEISWRLQGTQEWTRDGNYTRSPVRMNSPVPIGEVAVIEVRIRMLIGDEPATDYSPIARVVTHGE